MKDFGTVDFTSTIRDYEFTRRAIFNIGQVIHTDSFAEMDSEAIFQYIYGGMEMIPFHQYLKRYLYEKSGLKIKFTMVDESLYRDMIEFSFQENETPFSLTPTKKRKSAIIKGWLSQRSMRRDTLFLLGFGLGMPVEDVTEFLTKVLKEDAFNFDDPTETVYWYCYRNGLPYQTAKELLAENAADNGRSGTVTDIDEVQTEESLREYLAYLKHAERKNRFRQNAYAEFDRMVDKSRELVAELFSDDSIAVELNQTPRQWSKEEISDGDIEQILCCGIPLTEKGQLSKASLSLLADHFAQKRMTRQRIHSLQTRKQAVDRFDLITMLFFIYAQTMQDDPSEDRFRAFLAEINPVLLRCGMIEFYPVNPYESFILMCLLTDCPIAVFSDIWERSYHAEN